MISKFLDSSAPRVPGLDLMRGLAIVWVMLFHFHYANLPHLLYWPARYGWLGVDLFFVLSGYLIGSQLLRPYLKNSAPSLTGFYTRRAFRILPAFLAVLALYFSVPGFREAPGISPAWQFLTFTENFRINYAVDQAFSHFWSLCVEEHFYMVLPLLILALMRKPAFGKALAVILGVLVFGIAVRSYIYTHQLQPLRTQGDNDGFALGYIEKIYYPTYTRLDGLLVGVTLACIKSFRPLWWERLLAIGLLKWLCTWLLQHPRKRMLRATSSWFRRVHSVRRHPKATSDSPSFSSFPDTDLPTSSQAHPLLRAQNQNRALRKGWGTRFFEGEAKGGPPAHLIQNLKNNNCFALQNRKLLLCTING